MFESFHLGLNQEQTLDVAITQEELMAQEYAFHNEMRMNRPTELWQSVSIYPGYGFQGSKDAWFEELRASILHDIDTDGDCLTFIMLFGEPGSGKTKLGHDLAVQLLYGRDPEDTFAIEEMVEDDKETEVLVSTFDWGAPFRFLPPRVKVPGNWDYRKNRARIEHKQRELSVVSDLYGMTLDQLTNRYYYGSNTPPDLHQKNRLAHFVLCDHPGPTGLPAGYLAPGDPAIGFDRATDVLHNLVNHTGAFKGRRYRVVPIGLVASKDVLLHNRGQRNAVWNASTPEEIAQVFEAVHGRDTADQQRAMNLYKHESASMHEIQQFERDVEEYLRYRLIKDPSRFANEVNIEDMLYHMREWRDFRQEQMASVFLPDFFQNIIQVPDAQQVVMLYNGSVLPSLSFSTVARHRPLEDLNRMGYVQKQLVRSAKRIVNGYYNQAAVPSITL